MVLNDNKIKIYTPSMVSKYLEIFLNYFMDCLIFLFIPIVLMPFKLDFNIVFLCMILIMVLYYKKINKNYFPFLLEMYKNKVRIRNYDDSFWKPFFMAKFIDVTIDFTMI